MCSIETLYRFPPKEFTLGQVVGVLALLPSIILSVSIALLSSMMDSLLSDNLLLSEMDSSLLCTSVLLIGSSLISTLLSLGSKGGGGGTGVLLLLCESDVTDSLLSLGSATSILRSLLWLF